MDVKVVQSKSLKKVIFAETNGDFFYFIFSFLNMPLGSIVKLLGPRSLAGCIGNLYKSVENLDPKSVLLNPGIAPQFGCPNPPLNIPYVKHPAFYYYSIRTPKRKRSEYSFDMIEEYIEERVISTTCGSKYCIRTLTALDPPNRSEKGVVGFVKREVLYGVGDDLKVKPLSVYSRLSYLKELSLPLEDLEVKEISIGEAEVRSYYLSLNLYLFSF